MPLRWEMLVNIYDRENKHLALIKDFASAVSVLQVRTHPPSHAEYSKLIHPSSTLQDKTNSVIDTNQEINRLVEELSTCTYSTSAFAAIIEQIQAIVCLLFLLNRTSPSS